MTQEIVDAVKMLEPETGIAADTLIDALQDALLSAYKKTPGAAKYAKVELDHSTADFRVYELIVPEDLEKRLLDVMFEEYKDRIGELITGIIQQSDNRYTLVQLRERVEALLPRSEQVYNERYDHGARIKAVITDVSAESKGPSIVVSRRDSELIRKLFELEVPEIADKLVEIVGVAREPGWRSKIA